MNTDERREQILYTLKQTNTPITGSELANIFKVSRQIIVGDITVLRASGHNIFATPRGYLLPHDQAKEEQLATIACQHNDDNLQTELEIIIDNGGKVRDVIVEHPLYGEIRVNLFINSRRDIQLFLAKKEKTNASALMSITKGLHYHTIEIPNMETFELIKTELNKAHILIA